jgi:methionine synthase I (cobalamin-dependent)
MRDVHRRYGIKILGGCCGSDTRHIAALAAAMRG